jgi:hypothetical protein
MSRYPLYGYPHVDNPNDFEPDPECSSPDERAAHALACKTFGKPEHQPNKGCFSEHSEDGQLVLHVARTSWGLGTNLLPRCDGCQDFPVDSLITCHECGGPEFCAECWPQHEKEHDDGRL